MTSITNNTNKRVRFASIDEHHFIESRKDYTEQEVEDSWWSSAHLDEVSLRRVQIASEWDVEQPSRFCIRGLEQYTPQGETRTQRIIELVVDAVMDEQEIQWAARKDDYDRLAVVSQKVSKFSISLALIQAEQDELEAQRIHKQSSSSLKKKKKRTKKGRNSKKAQERKENSKSKPIIVVDESRRKTKSIIVVDDLTDQTSVCSDLSHPQASSGTEDLYSCCGTIEAQAAHSKGTKKSLSPSSAKVKAIRLRLKKITHVLKVIHA